MPPAAPCSYPGFGVHCRRRGFIRLAIESGAPVVPVFVFGQTDVYNWYRLGPPLFRQQWIEAFSRRAGFAPMLLWGWRGTPIPNPVGLTVVMGEPLEMPRTDGAPTDEMVDQQLERFIQAMESLFHRHRDKTGYPDRALTII